MNDIFDMWGYEDGTIVAEKDCDSHWFFESNEEIDMFINELKSLQLSQKKI